MKSVNTWRLHIPRPVVSSLPLSARPLSLWRQAGRFSVSVSLWTAVDGFARKTGNIGRPLTGFNQTLGSACRLDALFSDQILSCRSEAMGFHCYEDVTRFRERLGWRWRWLFEFNRLEEIGLKNRRGFVAPPPPRLSPTPTPPPQHTHTHRRTDIHVRGGGGRRGRPPPQPLFR